MASSEKGWACPMAALKETIRSNNMECVSPEGDEPYGANDTTRPPRGQAERSGEGVAEHAAVRQNAKYKGG